MKFIDSLKLKINNYLIIDNFFPDDLCNQLRNLSLRYSGAVDQWRDYQSINFDYDVNDFSLREIANTYVTPKVSFLRKESYIRSWTIRFDNVGLGVGPHTDPAYYTVNVWVTPEECLDDSEKNGLIMYKKKRPEGDWGIYNDVYGGKDYGWSPEEIYDYVKDAKYDVIPYKYNRAIVFRSDNYHETCRVKMKPGVENTRVSYTFLYNK